MKKLFTILLIFFLSSRIQCQHNQIILPCFQAHNPVWMYEKKIIHQHETFSLFDLVETWDKIIKECWKDIETKLHQELGIYSEQIDEYIQHTQFINCYNKYHQKLISDIIELRENSLLFDDYIQLKINYLDPLQKNISWHILDTGNPASFTFGNHQTGYHIVLQKNFFDDNFIQKIHTKLYDDTDFFLQKSHNDKYPSHLIYWTNCLHAHITQNLSIINHDHDYFSKILQVFSYNKKSVSEATKKFIYEYTIFLSCLESALQSKNPLEIAIYWYKTIQENTSLYFMILWDNFIHDVEQSYNDQDLADYKIFIKNKKTAQLFIHSDDI